MPKSPHRSWVVLACAGISLLLPSPSRAYDLGTWALGVYSGAYFPNPDLLESGVPVGISMTYLAGDGPALVGTVEFVSLGGSGGPFVQKVDAKTTHVEFGAASRFVMSSFLVLVPTGGIGLGISSASAELPSSGDRDPTEDLDEAIFTFHAGLGAEIPVAERAAITASGRLRLFTGRASDMIDPSVGIGLLIGFR